MPSEFILSSTYWNHFLRYAEEQGVDLSVAGDAGVFTKGQAYVSLAQLKSLVMHLIDQGMPPSLGLDVADGIQVSSHGHLGFGLSHAKDLAQCLEFVVQYYQTRAQILDLHTQRHAGGLYLVVTPCGEWEPITIVLYESILKLLLNVIRFAVGNQVDSCLIDVPYSAPVWQDRYASMLTSFVNFDANVARIHIPETWLSIPCVSGDESTLNLAKDQCEVELVRLSQRESIQEKIAQLVESTQRYDLSIDATASQLNMSKSTLIRKLKQENTSFKEIIEALKKRYAVRLLTQTDLKIEVISIQLGYEDVSNFSRTFKRWFACSPSAYREQNQ